MARFLKQKTDQVLSDDEVAAYHRDGFVIPKYRLSPAETQSLRDSYDRLLKEGGITDTTLLLMPHVSLPEHNHVPAHLTKDWLEIARHPKILDAVEQIIGPNIILWSSSIFGKPAGTGKETPWHQDGEFWPLRPLATCSVWVSLDHSTRENGCLRVIPGSHCRKEVLSHGSNDSADLALSGVLDPAAFNDNDAVDLVLEPGQFSMHDVYMIHGSEPNRSPHRRAGLTLRYMPTSSFFDREFVSNKRTGAPPSQINSRPMILLRGKDISGRNSNVIAL